MFVFDGSNIQRTYFIYVDTNMYTQTSSVLFKKFLPQYYFQCTKISQRALSSLLNSISQEKMLRIYNSNVNERSACTLYTGTYKHVNRSLFILSFHQNKYIKMTNVANKQSNIWRNYQEAFPDIVSCLSSVY